jgi:hypothetical protein
MPGGPTNLFKGALCRETGGWESLGVGHRWWLGGDPGWLGFETGLQVAEVFHLEHG